MLSGTLIGSYIPQKAAAWPIDSYRELHKNSTCCLEHFLGATAHKKAACTATCLLSHKPSIAWRKSYRELHKDPACCLEHFFEATVHKKAAVRSLAAYREIPKDSACCLEQFLEAIAHKKQLKGHLPHIGNYLSILCAVLNTSWKLQPTKKQPSWPLASYRELHKDSACCLDHFLEATTHKKQLYGHLPPIWNYTRILHAVLIIFWKLQPTKKQLYSYLPQIT